MNNSFFSFLFLEATSVVKEVKGPITFLKGKTLTDLKLEAVSAEILIPMEVFKI